MEFKALGSSIPEVEAERQPRHHGGLRTSHVSNHTTAGCPSGAETLPQSQGGSWIQGANAWSDNELLRCFSRKRAGLPQSLIGRTMPHLNATTRPGVDPQKHMDEMWVEAKFLECDPDPHEPRYAVLRPLLRHPFRPFSSHAHDTKPSVPKSSRAAVVRASYSPSSGRPIVGGRW